MKSVQVNATPVLKNRIIMYRHNRQQFPDIFYLKYLSCLRKDYQNSCFDSWNLLINKQRVHFCTANCVSVHFTQIEFHWRAKFSAISALIEWSVYRQRSTVAYKLISSWTHSSLYCKCVCYGAQKKINRPYFQLWIDIVVCENFNKNCWGFLVIFQKYNVVNFISPALNQIFNLPRLSCKLFRVEEALYQSYPKT